MPNKGSEGRRYFRDNGYLFVEVSGRSVYPTKESAQRRKRQKVRDDGTTHRVRKTGSGWTVFGTD